MTIEKVIVWMVAASVIMLVFTRCSQAQVVDDAHLRHICLTKQPGEQAACAGFVVGVIDASPRPHPFCVPDSTSPEDVVKRIGEYITRNPNHLPGSQQVILGLKAIWPCTQRAPQISIPPPECVLCRVLRACPPGIPNGWC